MAFKYTGVAGIMPWTGYYGYLAFTCRRPRNRRFKALLASGTPSRLRPSGNGADKKGFAHYLS